MIDRSGILMIEPENPPSREPVIDELTRIMATALRNAKAGDKAWRGFHTCSCGAHSSNRDHFVTTTDGRRLKTNSLAVHYLAYHRHDVPKEDLAKVLTLASAEPSAPDEKQLCAPKRSGRR